MPSANSRERDKHKSGGGGGGGGCQLRNLTSVENWLEINIDPFYI